MRRVRLVGLFGDGQMSGESFDKANYGVTALDAENVEYSIVHTCR